MSRFPHSSQPDPAFTWTMRVGAALLTLALAAWLAYQLPQREPAPHVYPCDATWAPQDCPPNN